MKRKKNNNRGISCQDNPSVIGKASTAGITLVALVVTIVVLLILAGITIVYVFGDNSIFKLAQDAKDKTDRAKQDEQEYFNHIGNDINDYVNGNIKRVPIEDIINKKQDKNTLAKDSLGNPITIPAGFKIVPNSGEKPADKTEEQWNAEKVVYSYLGDEAKTPTVQDGIVIQNEVDGNQFVWVPVGTINNKKDDTEHGATTTITLGRYSNFTVTDGVLPTPAQEASKTNYDTPVAIETNCFEVSSSFEGGTVGETTYQAARSYGNTKAVNLKEWISTTLDNGGYYLARYEASHNETDHTKAASKAGKTVWGDLTQLQAATAARATYSSVNGVNKENYYSDLVNSYAWDTAIVFIEAYDRSDYASKNLSTAFTTTGTNPDKVCNIHDMSGNACEWTTETSTYSRSGNAYPCTGRGGFYDTSSSGAGYYTNYRGNGPVDTSYSGYSYRLVLYVK